MICNIVRELTYEEKVRSYHTTVSIPQKVRKKINKLPGVIDPSLLSEYEICVTIGQAFYWDLINGIDDLINGIDEEIIQILQENFISREKLDSNDEVSLEIETVDSGKPTFLAFCSLRCSLKCLHEQDED